MAKTVAAMKSGNRNRTMLFLALLFGLVSAFLVFTVLKSADSGGGGETVAAMVPVVTAAEDIPAGIPITAEMLEVGEVAVEDRTFDAYSTALAVEGMVAAEPIVKGAQIGASSLALTADDLGLSYAIPEGMRAVAVSVNEAIATGGNLKPGDYVDILSIVFDQPQEEIFTQGLVLLQDVRVLAIAQTTRTPRDVDASGDTDSVDIDAETLTTVTLAVAPDQAEKILAAEASGQIRLALRGFDDHAVVATPGFRLITAYVETTGELLLDSLLDGVPLPGTADDGDESQGDDTSAATDVATTP